MVSALSDVINWDYKNCKKIPVKIKKSLPPKFTLNEEDGSQAFEALQKSHVRRVVPKGKRVRDSTDQEESPNKRGKKASVPLFDLNKKIMSLKNLLLNLESEKAENKKLERKQEN